MSRAFSGKGEIFLNEMLAGFLRAGYPVEAEGAELLNTNTGSARNGLMLDPAQALELAQTHRRALGLCGRIEIGTGTVQKIIGAFGRSHYLWQKDYADVLKEAVEAFYELKNESEDNISDDDLIALLAGAFERYKGTLSPFLQSRELDRLLRTLRYGAEEETDEPDEDETEEDDE